MDRNDARLFGPQDTIWQQLAGKRIVLAGIDNPEYQAFFQNLVSISSQTGVSFRIVDGAESAKDGDYILMFARPSGVTEVLKYERAGKRKPAKHSAKKSDKSWDVPFEEVEEQKNWEANPENWKAARTDWSETLQLLEQMRKLEKIKPEAVLLISGNEVYGKMFGVQHPLKEEETGYICHTDSKDMTAQCLRTAEHFACRLVQETKLPLKIARMGALMEDNRELQKILAAGMKVLLYGQAGEIYNLPGSGTAEKNGEAADGTASYEDAVSGKPSVYGETVTGRPTKVPGEAAAYQGGMSGGQIVPEPGEEKGTLSQGQQSGFNETAQRSEDGKIVPFKARGVKATDSAAGVSATDRREAITETVKSTVDRRETAAETAKLTVDRRETAAEASEMAADHRAAAVKAAEFTADYTQENRSPLAPAAIVTDTQKAEKLGK